MCLFVSCQKKTIHPEIGEIVEAVYGLGTVESEYVYNAKAATLNSVEEFYVSEGDDVVRGQKLFKTDQGNVTLAPFSGRITDIPVSVKENLFAQTTILTLISLDKLYLAVSLEQQGAMRIGRGIKAEISFEFFRNNKLFGTVSTIYPSKNQFVAKVELQNWPKGVLPGMTADVAFEIDRKAKVTLVPINAVVNGHLKIKRDGKKIKIPVNVGLVDTEKVEIISPQLLLEDEIILP